MKNKKLIIGAVIGDMIGSSYEMINDKTTDIELFKLGCKYTDDSVLTIATMDALMNKLNYADAYHQYGNRYPAAGYGGNFISWLYRDDKQPYDSWGNGSGMRVSPVGWAFDTLEEVLNEAKRSAEVTHDHPEGIKGAQAIAACVFLSRTGKRKQDIKDYIEATFSYNLGFTLDEIRPTYVFDVSCQGSVPQAIRSFYESIDFESAIRLGISLGGDSDTIAAMAGSIAEAYYDEVPKWMEDKALELLPVFLRKKVVEFGKFLM